jgi:predicted RNA binding protein YcfA (HicA-like mRNA interferase family)
MLRVLERAGFSVVRVRGSHASMHNPRTGMVTTVLLTRKALPVGTLSHIVDEAGLTPDGFRRLLE